MIEYKRDAQGMLYPDRPCTICGAEDNHEGRPHSEVIPPSPTLSRIAGIASRQVD